MLIGISGKIGSGKDTIGKIIQYLVCLKLNTLAPHQFSFKDFVESTASNEIQSGFKIKKYADKLKDFVCMLIGCTREQLEDQEFKNTELPEEWWKYEVSWHEHAKVDGVYNTYEEACEELRNFGGSSFDEKSAITTIKLTPRLLLQIIGTECIRDKVHPNAWVNALFADYKYEIHRSEVPTRAAGFIDQHVYPNWIITDMRFPNELEAVKKRGGITIRVERFEQISTNIRVHGTGVPHESETALDNAEFDYVIENNSSIEDLIHTVSLILKREKII